MSGKLGLWLALTFLVLQVASSSDEESIELNNQIINYPNQLPLNNQLIQKNDPEFSFQKTRWFQCCVMLRFKLKVPCHITQLILSYLTWVPVPCQLCPHEKGLVEAAVSRNSRWLLSISFDYCLHLSDLATGAKIRTFTAPICALYSCTIADNRSFVAAGGWQDIYVWNTNSEKLVATLTGHTDTVRTCTIFFNDTRIASGSYDETVRVWQVEHFQWKSLYVLKGHTDIILSIFTLPNNPQIISFAWDKTLRVWNSDTGKCLQILMGYTNFPCENSCVMSLDHRLVGSISEGATETNVWDITTGTRILTIINISGSRIRFSGSRIRYHIVYLSSKRLVWWQSDKGRNKVGVWNLLANKKVYTLLFEVQIKRVSVSGDGKYLIIVLNDFFSEYVFVQIYNFETGTLIK